MPAMTFGVFVPQGWKMDLAAIADPVEQFEAMTNVARVADKGQWDSVWVYDHFHTVPEPTMNSVFESLDDQRHAGPGHEEREDRADGQLQRLSPAEPVRQNDLYH